MVRLQYRYRSPNAPSPPLAKPSSRHCSQVEHLTATSLGAQLPCLFGWVAALLCELRVQQDVMNDLYGSTPWPLPELKIPNLQEDTQIEKMEIMAALRRRDEKQMMQLQSRGRWILRDLIHGGHRALALLDSSGWAKFSDLLEALPPGELGPALDASALVLPLQFQAPGMAAPRGEVLRHFKVWAVSAHPSLLLEPISQWRKIADVAEVVMATTLSTSHCTAAAVSHLTCDDEMWEMFHQLGTREDGLGHFPLVENFQEFSGNFLHHAKDFLQSDLLLCGEPAFLCWLLYEYKPVIGYLGNPLGAYLTTEWQMLFYDFVAKTLEPRASLQLGQREISAQPEAATVTVSHSHLFFLSQNSEST
eukprot:s192_g16.t1